MNVPCVWLTYFTECIKTSSFLYLKLLQYESIIPIKATPERRPVFSGLLYDLTISAPTSTPQAFLFSCSTVSLCKANHKMGLGTLLAKKAHVLWDTSEVSPNEATGILRMLTRPWELWRLTQGSRTDVPWMPAVLLYDPTPLGSCQHHSGHSFWLEIVSYCERLHWYERNIFIKRSIRNLLGKSAVRFVCSRLFFLKFIFLPFCRFLSKDNNLPSFSATKGCRRWFIFHSFLYIKYRRYCQSHFSTVNVISTP